jgi:hypothetical protein
MAGRTSRGARWGWGLALVLLAVAGMPGAAFGAPVVGNARTVVRDVQGAVETEIRTIFVDSDVYQNEEVVTGPNSATRLVFQDGTNLTLGENSKLRLTRLVFDPDPSKSKVAVKATQGVFRWTSGNLPSSAYGIASPVATIGVRGTTLEFYIAADGTTTVAVSQGIVDVSNLKSATVTLHPGESTTVVPPDTPATQPAPTQPSTPPNWFVNAVRAMTITVRMADVPSEISPAAGPGAALPTSGPGEYGGGSGGGLAGIGGAGDTGVNPGFVGFPALTAPSRSLPTLTLPPLTVPAPAAKPVVQIVPVAPDGPARIGTPSFFVVVDRSGNIVGTLQGTVGSAGFTLTSGQQVFGFALTEHGPVTFQVPVTLTDSAGAIIQFPTGTVTSDAGVTATGVIEFKGTGVGPEFGKKTADGAIHFCPSLQSCGTFDFGTIAPGTKRSFDLDLVNATEDASTDPNLVGLTLLGFNITGAQGDWSNLFTVDGFTPGEILMPGEVLHLHVIYTAPTGPVDGETFFDELLLTFFTDQGAPLGEQGLAFSFELSGGVDIPEPASLALFATALLAGWRLRRR